MAAEPAVGHPALAGIGIGVGGLVRERAVVGENDVAALVEAETWFGAGRGLDRFVVLTIGAGFGYGLVLGGRRVPYAEEDRGFGRHLIINPDGPLTPDGARGSAVSLLGIPSIRYQIRAATGRDATYEEIVAAAARALGTLVAQIANFAMPQKILLAGEGVGLMDVAGGTVRETIAAHRHPQVAPVGLETKISDFARLGAWSSGVGDPGPRARRGPGVNSRRHLTY